MFGERNRFFLFAVASFGAHAAFAALWIPGWDRTLGIAVDSPIEVAFMQAPSTPIARVTAARSPRAPVQSFAASRPTSSSDDLVPPTNKTPTSDPDANTPAPPTESAEGEAQLRTHIGAELAHYFRYPAIARRNSWEGTVWLAFTVAPDGALHGTDIARGSGYPVLDRAALNALNRVVRLPSPIARLNATAVAIKLPVVYRLED